MSSGADTQTILFPDTTTWQQEVFVFTAQATSQTLRAGAYHPSSGHQYCVISFAIGADLIKVVKTASGGTSVGDVVTFTMTVENTSVETLTAVAISEDVLERADGTPLSLTTGPTFVSSNAGSPEGTLQVAETATYTATYTLVQEDFDAGGISNQATGVGTASTGEFAALSRASAGGNQEPTVVSIPRNPSYDFVKNAVLDDANDNGRADAGEVINYTFTVENTGNVTLTDVAVTDSKATISGSPIATLAPATVDFVNVTGTYTVTEADLASGSVDNVASAVAKDPNGDDVPRQSRPPDGDPGDPTSTPTPMEADYDFVKAATHDDANDNGLIDAGEVINYTFTVENTGNVTLTDVVVTDSRATVSGSPIPSLAAGAVDTTSVTGVYTVTQADVDAGDVDNVASASAKDPNGDDVPKQSRPPGGNPGDPTRPPGGVQKVSDYDFVKEAAHVDANSNGRMDAGETIDYTFTVTNTGNVTLTDVAVTDSRATVSGSPIASLAPGVVDMTSVTGTYTITQADIDAGNVDNVADANAKDPDGNDVPKRSSPPGGNPGDPTSPPGGVQQVADYDFVKEATHDDANDNGFVDAGEVINYTFTIENTGNVSLTNIVVTDSKATVSGSPISGPLAPGDVDSTSVTGVYTVTQADIDSGNVDNVASASAKDPNGDDVTRTSRPPGGTPGDPTSFPVAGRGEIDLVKEATLNDANANGFADAGETVDYAFTVTNTGNVSLTDIVVEDDKATVSGSPIAGPLAPGVSDTSATGVYTITQGDIDAGSFENVAEATGKDPKGEDVTALSRPADGVPGDATVIPFAANPAIEL
ncbi:DUF7507 domain-containing protein, partial [Nitratireductor soli]|uniref:DUF7507 domain-containing protein n=1 Tax=Nitratireductor soli TaxID=1670619 RepID=UPI00138F580F